MASNQGAASVADIVSAVRGGMYPWWYPKGAMGLAIDEFTNAAEFLPLAANATQQSPIAIGGDAAFVILSAVMIETATDNVTFLANWPVLFQLNDGGSGRNLSNIPVAANNYFGTAQDPLYWLVPKILAPNATFTVIAQNLDATDRNVRVAFHGFKIFNFVPGS